MAEDDNDQDSKTEEPSQKRLEDARKKGQIPSSKELNTFFLFATLALVLSTMAASLSRDTMSILSTFISRPEDISSDFGNLHILLEHVVAEMGSVMLVPLFMFMLAALAAGGLQTRFNISAESLKPKLEKISILKGFGRIFSKKGLFEFIKGIFKIVIAGLVAFWAVWPSRLQLQILSDKDTQDILALIMALTKKLLISIVIVMFLLAIVDYVYQRFVHLKSLRMTKQEVREEYRQQEGDPHVKQRLKSIRAERARKRMMAAVPDADVVITNPTHFAVALRYDAGKMEAPIVVAKGVDKVAFKIREIAEKNKVMVMRNPPLARALYDNTDIDEKIPLEYYKAVAQIIGYVYKLKGRTIRPPEKNNNKKK
ncbi:MAG: flagellar biosynthesis protein FlhB [Rickettsiales bacterium]|nr:flagellar biosynthesis protein FlhB [Rickettsiales bacterium]